LKYADESIGTHYDYTEMTGKPFKQKERNPRLSPFFLSWLGVKTQK
jgi:hypothetical protein